MLNKVQLIGFTGADAEIRTVSGGKKVATLRVATNRYTKKDGDRKDYTTWHQVEIWNQGAVGWLLTGVYVHRANGEFDRLTEEVLKEARK